MPAVARRLNRAQSMMLPLGPFTGMRDRLDPTSGQQNLARMLRNVYPSEPDQYAGVQGRPGFDKIGAQLGSGGDVQFIGQYTQLDGDEFTIAIVGGKFYTLNWGTSTWSEVVSAANFATASITVSSTARFYAVTFANTIVFTDGTNTPWTWDGQSGAGGLVSLTNAPVAFGPPTVYYGKLFFIKNSDRATFVWSEEATANTGYEAGGYNNAWTLRQTDANRLTRLLGANDRLVVFREYSTTAIVGEVTTNFQSTGTREAISSTIGTKAPASVFFDGSDIFFADSQGRPHVIKPGSEPIPIWEDFAQTLADRADVTKFADLEGYWHPNLELSFIAYEDVTGTERNMQLGFHKQGGTIPQAACVFDGYGFTRAGIVKNADGEPRLMHGSTDGYVYVHGTPDGTIWDDGFNAGDTAIEHEVKTNVVANSTSTESHFSRADLIVVTRSDVTVTVRSETATETSDALNLAFDSGSATWDSSLWDTDVWASLGVQHGAVGLNAFGPFCGLSITHESGAERFHLVSGSIEGRPFSRYPQMA